MKTDEPSFIALARKPDLDQETAFTICRMVSQVGWELVGDWDWNWLEKAQGDYRAALNPVWVEAAWKLLADKDWYSQQTTNDIDKRISTIEPLAGMTKLKTLVLQNNLVENLKPISGMSSLKELNFYRNKIADISPIQNLVDLKKLLLAVNPVQSLRVIERLPKLSELHISADQVAKFRECKQLPRLVKLDFGFDGQTENFAGFPEMPMLRSLMACSNSLEGVERFCALVNLTVFEGAFSSISPLERLTQLTHLSISTSEPLDIGLLGGLRELRSLYVKSPKIVGISNLSSLPFLHQMKLENEGCYDEAEYSLIKNRITTWDSEFKSDTKRFSPSLEIEVVDQATFDYYDSVAPYGVADGECNEEMLGSEHGWLVEKMADFLALDFDDGVDFMLPHTSGGRTERLVIYSPFAYESLRQIISGVQEILCHARHDWIVWFQSSIGELGKGTIDDDSDFIVWIYPNKIIATQRDAKIVRALIEKSPKGFGLAKSLRKQFRKVKRVFKSK